MSEDFHEVRAEVSGPIPETYEQVLFRGVVTLLPGQSVRRTISARVPLWAPLGTYAVENIVSRDGRDLASDSFVCTVE